MWRGGAHYYPRISCTGVPKGGMSELATVTQGSLIFYDTGIVCSEWRNNAASNTVLVIMRNYSNIEHSLVATYPGPLRRN